MGLDFSLYPYTKKWPKKPTTFRAKSKFYFRNFYDFVHDLEQLKAIPVPKNLKVIVETGGLDPYDLQDEEAPRICFYRAFDVARLFKKAMNKWGAQLKADKKATPEEHMYFKDYMKSLKRLQRLKPMTPMITHHC